MEFNSVELIKDALHKQGYRITKDFVYGSIGRGEYGISYTGGDIIIYVKPSMNSTASISYHIEFLKQRLHFHGHRSCHSINLADPWSLDVIDFLIRNPEESDDIENKWKGYKREPCPMGGQT